jgi:hypothetical protein
MPKPLSLVVDALHWFRCFLIHPRDEWQRTAYRAHKVSAVFCYRCTRCGAQHVRVELFR